MNKDFQIIWGTRQIRNHQLSLYLSTAVKVLKGMGIKAHDRIAICDDNSVEYIILLLALWQIKALAAPISPRWPDKTVASYVSKIGARHLFKSEEIKRTVYFDARRQVEEEKLKELELEQEVTIIATSGSSGEAKAAVHTWGNHYYSAKGSNEIIPLTPADRWLLSLPLYHISGIAITVRCILSGAGLIIATDNDLMTAIERARATHVSLVSTQLQRLLTDDKNHDKLRSLKCILLGGSAIPRALIEQSLKSNLNIYLSYGLTEMSSQVATGKVTKINAPCAKVLPYRELSISPEGEILVKGETLFKGYVTGTKLNLPLTQPVILLKEPVIPTKEPVIPTKEPAIPLKEPVIPAKAGIQNTSNSWFPTGDIGHLDPNGFLTITGRRDSMFISGGENIHPEEIEKALLSIKGIAEAIIVPKDDKEFGQRPVAFIKFTAEPLEDAFIIQSLKTILPAFKIPIAFLPWPQDLISQGIKISRQEFIRTLPPR